MQLYYIISAVISILKKSDIKFWMVNEEILGITNLEEQWGSCATTSGQRSSSFSKNVNFHRFSPFAKLKNCNRKPLYECAVLD